MPTQPHVRSYSTGQLDNNVYILVDPASQESVLIDAPGDAQRILQELEGTTLKLILMTHADPDHITALEEIHERTGAPVGVSPAEERRLPHLPDFHIHDGDVFTVGSLQIRAVATPGHTPGGMSFIVDGLVFAGDTLFPGGPGNTERPISSFEQIIDSIREKLFTLPEDTTVYPGHGKSTTIGAERPHLQEWIDRGW
jgi:glyoxylase-like metal-dependent hydrolase (beta-lactamase superfamily II)